MSDKTPYTPPFPKPLKKSDKRSWWNLFNRARKSWVHTLYEGSYENKMSIVKLPGMRLFMPKKPADAREMLTTNYKAFPKHKLMHDTLHPLLGDSIFTTNGEVWERQRRMLDPAFANAGLKKVFPLMVEAVKDMKDRLDDLKDGETCMVDQEMTHVTADIIMRTILSVPIQTKEALEVFHRFEEFQEKASRVNILAAFKLPRWLLPWDYVVWKKRGKQIRDVIGDIIKKRYIEFNEKNGETDYGDILEALMQSTDEVTGTKFNETELIDQIVMLFLAGHETSASALSWSFHILANQPELADELALEAAATYDSLDSIRFADVHKLKKTRDVFKETLRLYPPVAFFGRTSTGEKPLGEHKVEKGAAVTLSPWLIHRHRDVWQDPDDFKPERFREGENKKCPGAYLPFSQGPRICIGAAFAQQEAYMIIATVVRNFKLTPTEGHEPDPASRLTLRSLNGIRVDFTKRTEMPEPPEGKEGPKTARDESSEAQDADAAAGFGAGAPSGGCPFA